MIQEIQKQKEKDEQIEKEKEEERQQWIEKIQKEEEEKKQQLAAATLARKLQKRTCSYCGRVSEKKIAVCTGCNTKRYCNVVCQKEDWEKNHKDECHLYCKIHRTNDLCECDLKSNQ